MDEPTSPSMLWAAGDPWRELTDELRSEPATIVTWNGTSRLLEPVEGWQLRVPLSGGHGLALDGLRQRLTSIGHASPCGVVTVNGELWYATSRVVAVLAGLHPRWAADGAGQRFLDEHKNDPQAPGHPDGPCPTHLCVLRR